MEPAVLSKAFVNLMNTEIPLLELTSALCTARSVYYVPEDCTAPKQYLTERKITAAECKAIEASFALLQRLNKRSASLL